MSEPKLITPLMDGLTIGDPISQRSGVYCCPAIDSDTQQKYIIKVISIPASQSQLDALLLTGAYEDTDAALAYFKELAADTAQEVEILQHLARLEGFCAFDGCQVEPMDDRPGYNVYLKSPYRMSLDRYLSQNTMTHLATVNLGLDLCSALSACRRSGYLYLGIKPGNIFITDDKEYRLGDLGFVPLSSLQYASLPEKYRSSYTAPEIADALCALNTTMDTYAVGMILYQIYNGGRLPYGTAESGEALPAPAYADYEMAEIILKACAADPAERWEDPAQMGQALVSYMQRNGVNDTPIIPPMADLPEEDGENTLKETDTVSDTEEMTDEFLQDETLPTEETLAEMEGGEISEETSEMLEKADELIAHAVPQAEDAIPEETPEEEAAEEDVQDAPAEAAEEAVEAEEESAEEESPMIIAPLPDDEIEELPEKTKPTGLLIALISVLAATLLILSGWVFYKVFYLQPINSITFQATQSQLTVHLDTKADNSLLTVTCVDTYGNKQQSAVADNTAVFNNLRPDTSYRISVEISGLHKLTGVTTGSHTTATKTLITGFTAVTGAEDGSVILNFAVEGSEASAWRVYYSAEGEQEKSVNFTGRLVTITGLTVGKEYTFRLEPAATMFVEGTTTLRCTAQKITYAQDVTVLGFLDGSLKVLWNAPEGTAVSSWQVRCYNDSGYDRTITVTECAAAFDQIDPSLAYTIEVKAEGMTVGVNTYVTKNATTLKDLQVSKAEPTALTLSWTLEGELPQGGWLVLYRVDGSEQHVIKCDRTATTAVISPVVPDAHYEISILPAGGGTVFGGMLEYDTEAAQPFSGYWVNSSHMVFSMCRKPDLEKWDRTNVKEEDYTTSFSSGEKAAFVIRLNHEYTTSANKIQVLFVIRDEQNIPVSFHSVTRVWTNMWYQGYGIQEVPQLPEAPGSYTMEIYYNGASVTTQNFTVTAAE